MFENTLVKNLICVLIVIKNLAKKVVWIDILKKQFAIQGTKYEQQWASKKLKFYHATFVSVFRNVSGNK